MRTDIRVWNGAPTLFINGAPDAGLMHWHSKPREGVEDIARLAGIGVRLFTCGMGCVWSADGSPDFAGIDDYIGCVLNAHEDVLLMPRIGMDPPDWWIESNPEEMMLSECMDTGKTIQSRRASISSKLWQRDAAAALTLLIEHFEDKWGERVLGYHLAAGDCGEFAYDWGYPDRVLSDYSAPHLGEFRDWLRERYDGDVGRLRTAWNSSVVDFDTVVVPSVSRRMGKPEDMSLFDPATDRDVMDYLLFHSEAMADTVLLACGTAKAALRKLGVDKICGAYYGYQHWGLGSLTCFFNSGHHSHQRVLESPDVDFLSAPNHYQNRHNGGSYASQLLTGSLRLHGKFFYAEDDTGTHLAHEDWWGFRCADAETSASVLRRNFLGILQEGGMPWWMDWGGAGWYRDDTILNEFRSLGKFVSEQMKIGRESKAQIAVVLSDESIAHMRVDTVLKDVLIDRQLEELTAIGAPFDLYRTGDLRLLVDRPKMKDYRMVIFVGATAMTEEERLLIREKLACDGRTLLWIYAQGLATDDKWDASLTGELIGMKLQLHRKSNPCLVETFLTGTRVVYGSDRPIGPLVAGADTEVEAAGFLLDFTPIAAAIKSGYQPGLMIKQMPDWRSVWSAAPAMPSELIRLFARQAGVHVYEDRGDQVYVGEGWLGLHARVDGPIRIALARNSSVTDARSGAVIARGVDEFTISTRRGETYLWKYD